MPPTKTITPTATATNTPTAYQHIPYRVHTIVVQADGKIMVAGSGTAARLLPDGSRDMTFASFWPEEWVAGEISAMAVQADGKILAGGKLSFDFATPDVGGLTGLVRYNRDGSLDAAFDPAIPGRGDVTSLALQADGKILVGTGSLGDPVESPGIMRLHPDGSLDTTFDVGPEPYESRIIRDLAVQADGKVLVDGSSSDAAAWGGVIRLTRSGALDTTFEPVTRGGGPIVVQPDGKIVIGTSVGSGVIRINQDGSPDAAFNPQSEPAVESWAIAVQPDGKILVGGRLSLGKDPDEYLARLNLDGSPDTTFNPPLALKQLRGDSSILAIAVQRDGKILVGGQFDNHVENVYLIRLNPDGSLDNTFKPNPGSWTSP